MQDRVMVSSDKIQAIAAAINEKTGNNIGMTLEEMAEAIKNIKGESDGGHVVIDTSILNNGVYVGFNAMIATGFVVGRSEDLV